MTEMPAGQVLNVKELKRISDETETAKMREVLARRRKEEEEEAKARQDFISVRSSRMGSSVSILG